MIDLEFYTLKFEYSFMPDERTLFALNYPYTYSDLIEFIEFSEK